ncbi:hypothetical protein [Chelativorans sp. YIM 93263]|uniref:hypothetical protein n=1 Tax=Chelativorans sp. YIM 93263 TaxID=2906648 RepID=UPI002379687E|nr:hypothetical protein [Chelativorans sp. YIM 93263]
MIATGYSTREILAIVPCLEDANSGPCEGAVAGLEHKLQQIDKLLTELGERRKAVVERLTSLKASLADQSKASDLHNESHSTSVSLPHRVSAGRGRVPAGADSNAHR